MQDLKFAKNMISLAYVDSELEDFNDEDDEETGNYASQSEPTYRLIGTISTPYAIISCDGWDGYMLWQETRHRGESIVEFYGVWYEFVKPITYTADFELYQTAVKLDAVKYRI